MQSKVRRLCAALLSVALLLSLCACFGSASTEAAEQQAEAIELVFPLLVSGEVPSNLQNVEDALNDYVKDQIGASIRFVPVEVSTLENYYLLQDSAEQKADFICLLPAETELFSMVDAGVLMPLDDLLDEYGSGIRKASANVLTVGRLNGVQYLIPQVKETYTMGTSLEFNAALIKKYNLDLSSVRTIEDVEPLLAVIRANEPDVVPLVAGTSTTGYTQLLSGYDNLVDTLGVLNLQADSSLTVVDWYETDEFRQLTSLIYAWKQAGYLAQDDLTEQESGAAQVAAGKAFCAISTIMPNADYGTDTDNSSGVVEVQLQNIPQLLTSYQAGLEAVGISSSCKSPEKAMQFLELLYTDEYVVNLLQYGIEGENYTLNADGLLDNGGQYFLLYGQPSNQKLRYPTVEDGADHAQKSAAYTQRDVVSPAFGFVFDPQQVSQEIALCKAVVEKYYPVIDSGSVDPETEIPKFIAALKEAGIDRIVAEKQRQLTLWAQSEP